MKKSIFLFIFVLTAGFLSAQTTAKKSCAKTCAKTCTSKEKMSSTEVQPEIKVAIANTDTETRVASAISEADIAAEADENIERRQCEITGTVGYYSKKTCSVSGKVSYDEVVFDGDSNSFVSAGQVKAATKESKAKTCTKSSKACCASKKKGA